MVTRVSVLSNRSSSSARSIPNGTMIGFIISFPLITYDPFAHFLMNRTSRTGIARVVALSTSLVIVSSETVSLKLDAVRVAFLKSRPYINKRIMPGLTKLELS